MSIKGSYHVLCSMLIFDFEERTFYSSKSCQFEFYDLWLLSEPSGKLGHFFAKIAKNCPHVTDHRRS